MSYYKDYIFLIDEDPDYLAIYSQALEKQGFIVKTIMGQQACSKKIRKGLPDLVIISMKHNTLEKIVKHANRIRISSEIEDLPIIILAPPKVMNRPNLILSEKRNRPPVFGVIARDEHPFLLAEYAKTIIN